MTQQLITLINITSNMCRNQMQTITWEICSNTNNYIVMKAEHLENKITDSQRNELFDTLDVIITDFSCERMIMIMPNATCLNLAHTFHKLLLLVDIHRHQHS